MKICIFCTSFGVLLCLLFVPKTTRANCNKDNGPTGVVECVTFSTDYTASQWATCLTNVYIQQKSKGNHVCTDRTSTYCWYQCMIETHDVPPGNYAPVYEDCACDKSAKRTTQQPNAGFTLSPWCFSPSGEECSWYKQCLEARYPCEGKPSAYAITYAEKFCNLYTKYSPKFSHIGQTWINAVRKCLMMKLVPVLRSWVTITCDGIREKAFDSHSECYLSPFPGAPSICDLPCDDWWKSFWTIKSAFINATVESLKGSIDIIIGCRRIDCLIPNSYNVARFIFSIGSLYFNWPTSEELDEYVGDVTDAIASKLGWWDSGAIWYAQSKSSNLTSIDNVEVFITGKGIYDLGSITVSNFNLTAVTEGVMKAVRNGELFFSNIGNKFEHIYVKQMKECMDLECLRVTHEVTAPPHKYLQMVTHPPNKNTSSAFGFAMIACTLSLFCSSFLSLSLTSSSPLTQVLASMTCAFIF